MDQLFSSAFLVNRKLCEYLSQDSEYLTLFVDGNFDILHHMEFLFST